jgi:hypothetical protein
MTKRQGAQKRIVTAAAGALALALSFGASAALGETHGISIPGRSARIEAQRVDAPRVSLPATVRQEATTYRVTGDECAGSVCARGVAVTAPAVDASSVGGPVETPAVEVGVGSVSVSVSANDGARASAYYGAIGFEAGTDSLNPVP